jgi:mersacidin/lichenicidin family type 2 lantibiotic
VPNANVIRAWKDADYRRSLTAEQLARVPAHPAGAIEIRVREVQELLHGSHHGCFSPCRRCFSSGP